MRGTQVSALIEKAVPDKADQDMECREFAEFLEAYLSDELLVETNTRVFRHLEKCRSCREDLAQKRKLRQQMRSAVIRSEEFQIDPIFANRLTADLKNA